MATWALTTFTTPADLAKIEEEITQFTSLGTKTYLAQSLSPQENTNGTGIDISGGQGIYEVIGVVRNTGTTNPFKQVAFAIQDSDDGVTYAEIDTGQLVYNTGVTTTTFTSGDTLFKWVIPSHAENYIRTALTANVGVSTIRFDVYVVSRWSDKIELAKAFMGDDLERMLINAGLDSNMDYSDGDILLDVINNKDIFDYCSHYLTLSLIFEDLMTSGDENDIFRIKADRYYKRYKDKLDITFPLKNIDEDQDGTVDEYKEESIITHRLVR